MSEWDLLGMAAFMALGTGTYLRLVAKEARRREKHLLLRCEEKKHNDKLKKNRGNISDTDTPGTGSGPLSGPEETATRTGAEPVVTVD